MTRGDKMGQAFKDADEFLGALLQGTRELAAHFQLPVEETLHTKSTITCSACQSASPAPDNDHNAIICLPMPEQGSTPTTLEAMLRKHLEETTSILDRECSKCPKVGEKAARVTASSTQAVATMPANFFLNLKRSAVGSTNEMRVSVSRSITLGTGAQMTHYMLHGCARGLRNHWMTQARVTTSDLFVLFDDSRVSRLKWTEDSSISISAASFAAESSLFYYVKAQTGTASQADELLDAIHPVPQRTQLSPSAAGGGAGGGGGGWGGSWGGAAWGGGGGRGGSSAASGPLPLPAPVPQHAELAPFMADLDEEHRGQRASRNTPAQLALSDALARELHRLLELRMADGSGACSDAELASAHGLVAAHQSAGLAYLEARWRLDLGTGQAGAARGEGARLREIGRAHV